MFLLPDLKALCLVLLCLLIIKAEREDKRKKPTQVAHTPLVCPTGLVPSRLCFDAFHVILIKIIKHRSEFL